MVCKYYNVCFNCTGSPEYMEKSTMGKIEVEGRGRMGERGGKDWGRGGKGSIG